jgi:hypothetical protein
MDTVYLFVKVPDPLETLGWGDVSRIQNYEGTRAAIRLQERWGGNRDLGFMTFLRPLHRG